MNLRTPPASAFIAGSVVGPLVLPAAKKNSKPLKGERADGGVMTFASLALLLVAASGPIGRSNRVSSPFMKGLTHKLRAGPPEVDPLTSSTSLHDRCDTTVGLKFGSRYETVSPAPDGDEASSPSSEEADFESLLVALGARSLAAAGAGARLPAAAACPAGLCLGAGLPARAAAGANSTAASGKQTAAARQARAVTSAP